MEESKNMGEYHDLYLKSDVLLLPACKAGLGMDKVGSVEGF